MPSSENSLPELDLASIIESEVRNLREAVVKARRMHATKDIKAAGNEIEDTIREYISSRIPSNYNVGHGHIVDENLKVSPQIDIIITEGGKTPFLLRSSDGTLYCPYESVYCIGEVKTSYRRSEKQIHSFSDSLRKIKQGLIRKSGKSLVEIYESAMDSDSREGPAQMQDAEPPRHLPTNPLLSFMLFLDEGDFRIDDLRELYSSTEPRYLPDVVCFLEKGYVAFTGLGKHAETGGILQLSKHPDFIPSMYHNEINWVYWSSAPEGGYLSQLILDIYRHLQSCDLLESNLQVYLKKLLFDMKGTTFTN